MSVKKLGIGRFREGITSHGIQIIGDTDWRTAFTVQPYTRMDKELSKTAIEASATDLIPLVLGDFSRNKFSPQIYCLYKGCIYKFDRVGYSKEEMLLQIMELEDKERVKFERLKHRYSEAEKIDKEGQREVIPEEVRIAVWRRDEGKCVKCGSKAKLEYDHIIPISKGGSNTVRNIELLCEKCNREKKDNIQ